MQRIPVPCRLVMGLILVTCASIAPAAMYKWTDADGQVHYTQSPPPEGIQGEAVKPPPKVDTDSAVEELRSKEEAFGKRVEEKVKANEEAEKTAATAEEKAKDCDDMKTNLTGLQTHQRIYAGEGDARRRVGDEERQARIKDLQEKIAKDCN